MEVSLKISQQRTQDHRKNPHIVPITIEGIKKGADIALAFQDEDRRTVELIEYFRFLESIIEQKPRLQKMVLTQKRRVQNALEHNGREVSSWAKSVDKKSFIEALKDEFLYEDKLQSFGSHLEDVIHSPLGNWQKDLGKVIDAYNKAKNPRLSLPRTNNGLALCLLGKDVIKKAEFMHCLGIESYQVKKKKTKDTQVCDNEGIKRYLDTLLGSQTFREVIKIRIEGASSEWSTTIAQIFREFNSTLKKGDKRLPVSPIGIARAIVGRNSIAKKEFLEFCGIDIDSIKPTPLKKIPAVNKIRTKKETQKTPKNKRLPTAITNIPLKPKKPRQGRKPNPYRLAPKEQFSYGVFVPLPKAQKKFPIPQGAYEFGGVMYNQDGIPLKNQHLYDI